MKIAIVGNRKGWTYEFVRKIFLGGEYDTKETETTRTKKETIKTE